MVCKCQEHIHYRVPCPLRSEEDSVSPAAVYHMDNAIDGMQGWTLNILISHFSWFVRQLLLESFQCHS